MLLETFYKSNFNDDQDVINHFYCATLASWIVYNDFTIYDKLIEHFEVKEEYFVCEGINRALNKIDDIMEKHFGDDDMFIDNGDEVIFDADKHSQASKKVFEEVIIELYENQIRRYKKHN